jgi:hypothetical protein
VSAWRGNVSQGRATRETSAQADRGYSGQSHPSIRLNQRNKYHESRYTEGSIALQTFPDVLVRLEMFLSLSAIARNAEPEFQFAITKLSNSNRAVFSDTLNPALLK